MKNGTTLGSFVPAALILICSATGASAGTIVIDNYSFEAVSLTAGNYSAQNVPGWDYTGFASTYYPGAVEIPGGAPDGVNVVAISGASSLSQTLSAVLQANTTYTLTAGVGERTDLPAGGYLISLLAGGTVLASDSSQALISGQFITSTLQYTTAANDPNLGQALSIEVVAQSAFGITGVGQTEFDNFQLNTTPEPASVLLFGLAAVALYSARKAFTRSVRSA